VQSCVDGLWEADCVAAVPPTPELCGDGLDNDCNGFIDETCLNTDDEVDPDPGSETTRPASGGGSGGGCTLSHKPSVGGIPGVDMLWLLGIPVSLRLGRRFHT
jgi:hypothetical protein